MGGKPTPSQIFEGEHEVHEGFEYSPQRRGGRWGKDFEMTNLCVLCVSAVNTASVSKILNFVFRGDQIHSRQAKETGD
jgi:hypothetical protein